MGAALLQLSSVGKDYAKVRPHAGRVKLVYDLLRGHGATEGGRHESKR